jgi:hypothetical protein
METYFIVSGVIANAVVIAAALLWIVYWVILRKGVDVREVGVMNAEVKEGDDWVEVVEEGGVVKHYILTFTAIRHRYYSIWSMRRQIWKSVKRMHPNVRAVSVEGFAYGFDD